MSIKLRVQMSGERAWVCVESSTDPAASLPSGRKEGHTSKERADLVPVDDGQRAAMHRKARLPTRRRSKGPRAPPLFPVDSTQLAAKIVFDALDGLEQRLTMGFSGKQFLCLEQ